MTYVENDQTSERDKNGESKAPQHTLSMPDALIEIEIPLRPLERLIFCFLEGFLKLAIEDVLLLAFGFPGVAEFVFAFARLFRQDPRGVVDVDIRGSLQWRDVRKHDGKLRVHRQL